MKNLQSFYTQADHTARVEDMFLNRRQWLTKAGSGFGAMALYCMLAEQGWGLGLTITKALVDLHDGKLDIKSKVGKGTTITVTFPNSAL